MPDVKRQYGDEDKELLRPADSTVTRTASSAPTPNGDGFTLPVANPMTLPRKRLNTHDTANHVATAVAIHE